MRAGWLAATLAAGALVTTALWRLAVVGLRGGRWTRTNFRGLAVSLAGGPVVLSALALGALALVAVARLADHVAPADDLRRTAAAIAVSAALAGAAGVYDDLHGDAGTKGFAGHLRALRGGRLTSGLLKVAVIGLAALAGALVLSHGRLSGQVVVDAAVVAGFANLVNLLDLRPGRALKVVLVAALPVVIAGPAVVALALAWPTGVAVALIGPDLGERSMLGDGGANALGATLGVALASAGGLLVSSLLLAGVVALTALSEVVSFSAVIERVGVLRRIDGWGRAA